jgi:hypothetical protein
VVRLSLKTVKHLESLAGSCLMALASRMLCDPFDAGFELISMAGRFAAGRSRCTVVKAPRAVK